MEALADRLIPPDPDTPGGKDAGCAVFIDRQLAGPYGRQDGLYVSPPFIKGTKQQGPQDEDGPAAIPRRRWRRSTNIAGSRKAARSPRSTMRTRMQSLATWRAAPRSWTASTAGVLRTAADKTCSEGFFADPIYGGNRDMVAWRMIGYPGARYDYRDWVERHNERYPAAARQHHGTGRLECRARPEGERWRASFPTRTSSIIGLGWTGSIIAKSSPTKVSTSSRSNAGRGETRRPIFRPTYDQDELRYRIRHELFLRPEQTTFTFRNKMDQTGAADPHLGRVHAAERRRRRRASTGTRRRGASCRPTSS